jgi:transcriptional regulator with XRE-family HTH domain
MKNRIRDARKAAKFTQEELAKRIGITHATLSRYENGSIDPPTSQLQAIADVLKVSVSSLLPDDMAHMYTAAMWKGYEGRQFEDRMYEKYLKKQGYTFSRKEQRIIAAFSKMNGDGQDKVADYAEDILPRYRRQDPPESPPAPAGDTPGGTDTPTAQDAPEGAEEGE